MPELRLDDFLATATDATTAVEDWLRAGEQHLATYGYGTELRVPPGELGITRPVGLAGVRGLHFRGTGERASVWRWDGPAGVPMFTWLNSRECSMAHMQLYNNHLAARPSIVVEVRRDDTLPMPYGVPTRMKFRDLFIGSTDGTGRGADKGIAFTTADPVHGDDNNDVGLFEAVTINGCRVAGVSFEHGQSRAHEFYACHIDDCARGVTNALAPPGINGGSWTWTGGSMGSITAPDYSGAAFSWKAANDRISIRGCGFESGNRFLDAPGPAGVPFVGLIEDCTVACDRVHPDGAIVRYGMAGPIEFRANTFLYGTKADGSGDCIPQLLFGCSVPMQVHLARNQFWTRGSGPLTSWRKTGPAALLLTREQNTYRDLAGNSYPEPA